MIAILIQARLGSTRAPKKVLASIGGLPMVQQVHNRAQQIWSGTRVEVIVPTGEGPEIWPDGPVWEGPYTPLNRFVAWADQHPGYGTLVRLTADCPLLDPGVSRMVLEQYFHQPTQGAFTSLALDGLDTEVFAREAILNKEPTAYEREHVTPGLRWGGAIVDLGVTLRWSVDEPADAEWADAVYRTCTYCADGTPHHTNSQTSIGGSNRVLVVDLHHRGAGDLVECRAADLLQSRMGGSVYISA